MAPLSHFLNYLRTRAPLLGSLALLGGIWGSAGGAPDDDTPEALRDALGRLTGTEVSAVAWEPSSGLVSDLIFGRGLLFEGMEEESPRDIYRAVARIAPEGGILSLSRLRNLTATRASDEHGLVRVGNLALYGTSDPRTPPSIRVLSWDANESQSPSNFLQKLQLGIFDLVEYGALDRPSRVDFVGRTPEDELRVELDQNGLSFRGSSVRGSYQAEVSFDGSSPLETLLSESLRESEQAPHFDILYRERTPLPWLHFGADIGRSVLGVGTIAWLEGRAFSALDGVKRATYEMTHLGARSAVPDAPSHKSVASPESFPPADLSDPHGEGGKWTPFTSELLPKAPLPLFYRTVIHPDPERPYAELHLVAADMRRLHLGMRAGYEDPHPDRGPPGTGHLPESEAKQVVATFNGAFKAAHGRYGMKTAERVLVNPVPGAATIATLPSGRAVMGTWSDDQSEADFAQFRQNLDPLVEGGKANPRGRKVWGDHLLGAGVTSQRTALCLHDSGHLIYAWAVEATGSSLAEGLVRAGCKYAVHLDMNPGHCAFLINQVTSVDPLVAKGEVLDRRMQVNPTRYVRWSPKDFFYLTLRRGLPQVDGLHFEKAPGEGPSPREVVGITRAQSEVGGLTMEIDRVEGGRLDLVVAAGALERAKRIRRASEEKRPLPLSPPDQERTLIAWSLGHQTRGQKTGLSQGNNSIVPHHRKYATLVLKSGSAPLLLPPGEPRAEEEGVQLIQLPALARGGQLLPQARELGGHRDQTAMCMDPDGNLYFGRLIHDTASPLVSQLLKLGCELVVSMDRGSHSPAWVERRGTETAVEHAHDETVLYGLDRPMAPFTGQF